MLVRVVYFIGVGRVRAQKAPALLPARKFSVCRSTLLPNKDLDYGFVSPKQ